MLTITRPRWRTRAARAPARMDPVSARAAERAARIRALQRTGLQSQRAQLGALEAAASAAQHEIAALEAELLKTPKRNSQLGRSRFRSDGAMTVNHLKQKLASMSASDLIELQRCAFTPNLVQLSDSLIVTPPPLPRSSCSHVQQLDTTGGQLASAASVSFKAPPSARSTMLTEAELRWLDRAVEDEALADVAVETAKAAACMAAELPSAEEQEWMEGEMRKASEEHAWLECQASDAARRVAALKTTLIRQHANGGDADNRPLAAALPSPFSAAEERWLASEVQAHMQREAAAAAAIHMTQAAAGSAAAQPSTDEQEWLETEIGKAEEEHVWLERQASDAARRVAVLSKIVSPRHSAEGRVPLAAALPSPLTAAQERWLASEVETHMHREIAEDAAIEIARAMQDSASQYPSTEEQAWIDQVMSRAAEENTWLERQASDAGRRVLQLQRGAAVEAAAGARPPMPEPSSHASDGRPSRPPFDRPLLRDGSARNMPVSDGVVGRAFEDLHRIREQLAAVRRISSEADEVLDAMEAGSLPVQPRLKKTLEQLHGDCERLRAKGQSVLNAMAGAGPAARTAALQASEALSQASEALRERIEGQLRVFGLADERQALLQRHVQS